MYYKEKRKNTWFFIKMSLLIIFAVGLVAVMILMMTDTIPTPPIIDRLLDKIIWFFSQG